MVRSKKSLKKIQSLILLILITMVLAITATYAWFSTQRDVEIAGMRLNVEVAESMQISLDGEKWTQSIQIADMRQFYGTYDVSGDEGFAVFQAKDMDEGGNLNYVPTELVPVSTAGEVAGGKLQFVQGTIGTNADGSQSLTGITACSENDITTSATIGEKEGNNDKHPYLVFDMYLRNISAKTEGIDELLLNAGSIVSVATGVGDDADQEGKGVGGTGLEYSARVGMIVYGNTVSVTAEDNATLGTVGEQVRGITHNNSEVAAIWEPNEIYHTQYVVNNNGRGITGTTQAVTTYGIKSAVASTADKTIANVNADTDVNGDGIEDTNPNLVAVKTFKQAAVNQKETITNTAGNSIGLAPNQISKVRVYIWLEGQDPDCIDMASTGDKLNVNLKLTKEPNIVNENTYTGNYVNDTEEYIIADTLEATDYGGYVTNYTPTNGVNDEGVKWRIFHSDGDNIYLIADTYVPLTNEAGTKNYIPLGYNNTSGRYGFDLNAYTNYNGTADIDDEIASKWLKLYTDAGYTSSNIEINGKATAYLLDTEAWSGFKDATYAKYAVGAPTLELFAASCNKVHRTNVCEISLESDVYSASCGEITSNYSLYAIGYNYWFATPSEPGYEYGSFSFDMEFDGIINNMAYYTSTCVSRPIICLNDSVRLEKQEDGNYKIVE